MAQTSQTRMSVFSAGVLSAFLLFLPLTLLSACAPGSARVADPSYGTPEERYGAALESYQRESFSEAEDIFKGVMEDYPLHPAAVKSQLMLADLYYAEEKHEDAAVYYTTFYTFHPGHPKAPYALFQKGMSHFGEVLSIDRDQTSTRKALFAFRDLVESYPASPYAERAGELSAFLESRLAEREYYVGRFYFKDDNYKGALMRFGAVLRDYPDSELVDEALFYIGESYAGLGEEDLAEDAFATLVNDYPESPLVRVVRGRLE